MALFSATCPTVPVEQVRAEINALSPEEYKRLQQDLHDTGSDASYADEQEAQTAVAASASLHTMENALVLLNEALESLPKMERKAYALALAHDAKLVAQESDPCVFLRHAEYDCWKAAQNLAAYWRLRLEHFGPDRALQPMTQDGAMLQDLEILYAPSVTVTPPVCGGSRRFTFHSDRSRLVEIPRGNRKIFLRIIFYLFHKMTFSGAGDQSFVGIFNMKSFNYYKHFDRAFVKKLVEISTIMPIAFRAAHFCMGGGVGVINFLLPVYYALMPQSYRYRIVLHSGTDTENLKSLDESYGITPESVPERLGGSFGDEDFRVWLEEQRRQEKENS